MEDLFLRIVCPRTNSECKVNLERNLANCPKPDKGPLNLKIGGYKFTVTNEEEN